MIHPAILREEDEGPRLGAPAKRRKPNPELKRLVKEYIESAGLPSYESTPEVPWDEDRCRTIALEFEGLDWRDESRVVEEAYRALVQEIRAQYRFLEERYSIEPYGDDDPVPYGDSAEMMADVRENRHLWVYAGGEDHAFLSREENFMFRAVHDLFGHAAGGFGFGPWGEENAWVEHSKTLSALARAALTTETRAQNSWVNCGPHADLAPKERPYAEQKAALLPENRWLHPVVEDAYRGFPEFLYV